MSVKLFDVLGANLAPIALNELYTALNPILSTYRINLSAFSTLQNFMKSKNTFLFPITNIRLCLSV
ncbi:hypothetical protein HMPREF9444_00456 [Succinatimonas hippei YIT 12066]|uniref:Uncharacterized protein n=1 Tax=Succinatimonas hippei (strain DSM 22608 / JCM 16073 / KCTC 15190 / YIT 12066) TaxID=762983 RepID=E8LID9_SUCHY|nr:hypothetical protein HMPREF9444_00456 [Succinatimonas hippei YIT 12066]